MRKAYYFPHDYNARQDPKMQELMMDYGVTGIGIYWCIIEMLYEQGGAIPMNARAIAFTLHTDAEMVAAIIENYELFEVVDGYVTSNAVNKRMEQSASVSEKRREAGRAGGVKTQKQANAKQMLDNVQAKSSKENKIKINKNKSLSIEREKNACAYTREGEREKFLEIFFFEKNIGDAPEEVERFVSHYEANGWCRSNSDIPIKDREALARGWTPKKPQKALPDEVMKWLGETYSKAKAAGVAAYLLMEQVKCLEFTETKNDSGQRRCNVILECTKESADIINAYYAPRSDWSLKYAII